MIVWNETKTALVNLIDKDVKVETTKEGVRVVALGATGRYTLHTGKGFEEYFFGISLLMQPVNPMELVKLVKE